MHYWPEYFWDEKYRPPVVATTSAHCCRVFAGCGSLNECIFIPVSDLALLTYRCLHGSAPDYLSIQLQRVSDVCTRVSNSTPPHPWHSSFCGPFEPPSVAELSVPPRRPFETACLKQFVLQHPWRCSGSRYWHASWKKPLEFRRDL